MTLENLLAFLLGEVLIYIIVGVMVLLWFEGEKKLFLRTIVALIITWLIIKLIKVTWPSPRPFEVYQIKLLPWVSYTINESFPSAHAGMAFSIATSVWLAEHRLGLLLLFLAVLVSVGRVLLWVHFPVDVIVGGLIGVLVALLLNSWSSKTEV